MRQLVIFAISLILLLVASVSYLLWRGRDNAVIGTYFASGVWGSSTLSLNADHTSVQEVHFNNPYTGKRYPIERVVGQWKSLGREGFGQKIELQTFVGLAPWDRAKIYKSFPMEYGPVALSGYGIEVDIGAGIVYRKN